MPAQHTPGPWFVHDYNAASDEPETPMRLFVSCDSLTEITVAFMGRGLDGTMEEARANAHLIAAAPKMLATLKALRVALNNSTDFDRLLPELPALIAKAEGRG